MIDLKVICLDEPAFYALFDKVVAHVRLENNSTEDKWISASEAMKLLRIKSKTTLQKMRDEGQIRFTQPEKKIILYDRDSIIAYLEDFVYEPFGNGKK